MLFYRDSYKVEQLGRKNKLQKYWIGNHSLGNGNAERKLGAVIAHKLLAIEKKEKAKGGCISGHILYWIWDKGISLHRLGPQHQLRLVLRTTLLER